MHRTSLSRRPGPRLATAAAAALIGVACDGGSGDAATTPPPAPLAVDCSRGTTACTPISISGDTVAATPTFSGFADPALRADPTLANGVWMAYSRLGGKPATGAGGAPVGVPVVATHLARSDDGGASWRLEAKLWDSPLVADPEALGPASYFGSETPSLAVKRVGTQTTWYSVRLSYFLAPVSAYSPRYASSWTVRVAAAQAASPAALVGAPETVLGTTTTAAAYGAHLRLNSLSPALAACGLWNNPAITWHGERLHLITECVEFDGAATSATRSRIVVFSTDASGAPSTWSWRYAGVLADFATAQAFGGQRLVSADVSSGRDGQLQLTVAVHGGSTGDVGQSCQVLELASLDPPALARDGAGRLVVRATQTATADPSWHTGACTYDAAAATGLITVVANRAGGGLQTELRATALRP